MRCRAEALSSCRARVQHPLSSASPLVSPLPALPPTTHPPRNSLSELPSQSAAIPAPNGGVQSPRGAAHPPPPSPLAAPQPGAPPCLCAGCSQTAVPSSFKFQPLPCRPLPAGKAAPSPFAVYQIPCFLLIILLPFHLEEVYAESVPLLGGELHQGPGERGETGPRLPGPPL